MLAVPCAAMACPIGLNRRQQAPGSCWTECMLWRTAAKLLESLLFFQRGSLENRPERPRVLWRTVDSGPRFSGEPSDSRTHRPVPGGIQRPGRDATRPFSVANRSQSRAGHGPGEPGTQRIRRSGFLETTVEDCAVVASAMTLEAESRRSETDPPAFRTADEPEADPRPSRSDPSRAVRLRPERPLIGSFRRCRTARRQAGYAWRERHDREPMVQFGRGRVECRSIAATSARSS